MTIGSRLTSILILMVILFSGSSVVEAGHGGNDTYTLSGVVTDVNGDIIRGVDVSLDCTDGATDVDLCSHNARSSTTSFLGEYELEFTFPSAADGRVLVLAVADESFNHTITMTGAEGVHFISMDIQLSEDSSSIDYFIPYIVFSTIAIIGVLLFLKKKELAFFRPKKKGQDDKVRDDLVSCPRCNASLLGDNLLRHLTGKHHLKKDEALALISNIVIDD